MLQVFYSQKIKKVASLIIEYVCLYYHKYKSTPKEDLQILLREDFGDRYRHMGDTANFILPNLPAEFIAKLHPLKTDRHRRKLTVLGRGEFRGFFLMADGSIDEWTTSAPSASEINPMFIDIPAEPAAIKLSKFLKTKYGISRLEDMDPRRGLL